MVAATALFSACDKHEFVIPVVIEPEPEMVSVTYILPADLPEGTEVRLTESHDMPVATALPLPSKLSPDTYTLQLITPHPGVTVSPAGEASLTPAPDGEIQSAPLFSQSLTTFTVESGKPAQVSPELRLMSREVKLTVNIDGSSPSVIEECSMMLTGVAAKRDVPTRAGTADGYYIKAAAPKSGDGYVASFRLLAMQPGATATLTVYVKIKGEAEPRTFTQDAGAFLADFNTGDYATAVSFHLDLSVKNEGAMSGTIIPWDEEQDIPLAGK